MKNSLNPIILNLIIGVILLILFIGSLFWALSNTAKNIDESGGLKAIVERIWKGNPQP